MQPRSVSKIHEAEAGSEVWGPPPPQFLDYQIDALWGIFELGLWAHVGCANNYVGIYVWV